MSRDRMNREPIHDTASDPRIDRALGNIGSATPASGFEGRILNRLAAERFRMDSEPALSLWSRLPRLPKQALGLATACLLGFVVVAGSISHSRRTSLNHGPVPPPLVLPGNGIGAASAIHPAAPASTPAPAGEPGRAARSTQAGRARIAPHSRKAPGAVPAPPSRNPSSNSQD